MRAIPMFDSFNRSIIDDSVVRRILNANLKLTLDTNCVINLFDGNAGTSTSVTELKNLMRAGLSNRVDIAITTRVETDVSNDKKDERRVQMLGILNMFPVVGTLARWDTSFWGGEDVFANDHEVAIAQEIQKILFPGLLTSDRRYKNKINDVDHLIGHLINKRDIFVTDDIGILSKASTLKISVGVVVSDPANALRLMKGLERSEAKVLSSISSNKLHQNALLSGRARFDYSNNNGIFTIGEGAFAFDTKWSKASDISIHAYSDGGNVDALAIARSTVEIIDIEDAAQLDYSSRTRTPRIGQMVIWRNSNGFYAATKVLEIKDDTRGDDRDELVFEYTIQTNGSGSFA